MNIASENHSIYINNVYNYNTVLDYWADSFYYTYGMLRQGKYLPLNFKETLKEYPKYPKNFKFWQSTSAFNIQKIREIILDSTEYLIENLPSNVALLKPTLDTFPETVNKYSFEVPFQQTIFSNKNDLYLNTHHFINYFSISPYINTINHVIGNRFDERLLQVDFIQQVINIFLLNSLIYKVTDINMQLMDYLDSIQSFSVDKISEGFDEFIDAENELIAIDLTDIILKYIYSIIQPSERLTGVVYNTIKDEINSLKDYFSEYNDLMNQVSNIIINKTVSDCLLQTGSVFGTVYLFYNHLDVFPKIQHSGYQVSENEKLKNYMNKVSKYIMRNYLNLCYIYKFWPIKFLNTLPVIITKYVESEVFPISDLNLANISLDSHMSKIFEYIDLEKYCEALVDILDPAKLKLWASNNKISHFSATLYFLDNFDKFFESEIFLNHLTSLLESVYNILEQEGFVDSGINWNVYHGTIKSYYISLFRQALVRKKLFKNQINSLNTNLIKFFDNSFDPINGEVLSSSSEGDNLFFKTKYQFDESSVTVYINDIEQSSDDYYIHGKDHSISFKNYPPVGSVITADYTPSYNITIKKYDEDGYDWDDFKQYVEQKIEDFKNHPTVTKNIRNYIENIYLGTVNKQILYDILRYFKV